MDVERYEALSRPFRDNPRALRLLLFANDALTALCYVLYPLLLVLLWLNASALLARNIVVPALLFAAVSLFRRVYNEPRPYEALAIRPLMHKDTRGRSFPSRHIFSVFMIAMCWLTYCMPVGIALMVCGVAMAYVRVVGGVHYPRDVIAGALVAIVGGGVGLFAWPMG